MKANVCRNSISQVNRKKNATGRRSLTSRDLAAIFVNTSCEERHNKPFWLNSYLERPCRHFCQHFMRRTAQQTFLAINLASQQKATKLYFSSQVRKQFKLLTFPFKPLRCCLRSGKLVNCHVWKFCNDLFLNFRVI